MKRSVASARQGIALVITLIMLSVVTLTAVAFLAVSRRDRGASASSGEQIDVRFLADAALNRAKAEVAAGLASASNRSAFRFFVSTNYQNARANPSDSFLLTGQEDALTNVNYLNTTDPLNPRPFNLALAGDRDLYRRMLANLFYSPRPPVFVQTNRDYRSTTEFRFYLDLNRNGHFESNGIIVPTDGLGRTNGFLPMAVVGDPEWQGILEHTDLPHSGTNLFVGRVAYVVVPSGRALDANFNHNSVKMAYSISDTAGSGQSAFMRNEAAGGWEMNLAGFFSDLNTNIWPALLETDPFRYSTNLTTPSSGIAFDDASLLVRYRRAFSAAPLSSSQDFLARDSGTNASVFASVIKNDRVDVYSDGPIASNLREVLHGTIGNDQPAKPWSGSDYTNAFIEPNQLFDPVLVGNTGFGNRLSGFAPRASTRNSYDQYTFYRLLGQLGFDSSDARFESGFHTAFATPANPYGFYRRAKLHLNFAMDNPNGGSAINASIANGRGFQAWKPLNWFTNAAHRLLLSEFTNGLPFLLADSSGTRTIPGLAIAGGVTVRVTNVVGKSISIQQFRTNYVYNPQVHRMLQLAANIFDYATNRFGVAPSIPGLPSVFRPILYRDNRTNSVLRLAGYREESSTNNLEAWFDPSDNIYLGKLSLKPEEAMQVGAKDQPIPNAYGIPWVVGAKKGLPSFHEGFWQSSIQVTRRLLFQRKAARTTMAASEVPFSGGNGKGFETLAQYRLRITNTVAIDAYYAYTNPLPRKIDITCRNFQIFALKTTVGGVQKSILARQRLYLPPSVSVAANKWTPLSYVTALNSATNNPPIYDFIYDPILGQVYDSSTNYNAHFVQANRPAAPLDVYVTNNMVFYMTDSGTGRIIDFVTQQSIMVESNVFRFLGESTTGNLGGIPIPGSPAGAAGLAPTSVWLTNYLGVYGTAGISNQFRVATKRSDVPDGQWVNAVGGVDNPLDRDKAVAGLNYFLYHTSANQLDKSTQAAIDQAFIMQSGYNPTATVFLTDRRMANDPLVHYTADDLVPGYSVYGEPGGYAEVIIGGVRRTPKNGKTFTLAAKVTTNQVGIVPKLLSASAPWGTNANYGYFVAPKADDAASSAYDMAYKDPNIVRSGDWNFPTNAITRFANVGQLGRVHRGTPWQTVYLKSTSPDVGSVVSRMEGAKNWGAWAGNIETYPAKDRKILSLFTTGINDNAARGLMGVNQTNIASWSALLTGVPILSNQQNRNNPQVAFVQPSSAQLRGILAGYTNSNTREVIPGLLRTMTNAVFAPGGYFTGVGGILATPTLSDKSPFLNIPTNSTDWKVTGNLTDEVVERLPQQILSLVADEEPRVTVYSFAQTLKPAANSLVTAPGPFYGICTNYQVTSEYATKTVLRFDGNPRDLKAVVEDQRVIYPGY